MRKTSTITCRGCGAQYARYVEHGHEREGGVDCEVCGVALGAWIGICALRYERLAEPAIVGGSRSN